MRQRESDPAMRPTRSVTNLLNARAYIEGFLRIRDKENRVVSLVMNAAQRKLYEAIKAQHEAGRPVRVIILKARQMGFSTLTEALLFWNSATRRNVDSLVIAHKEEATANLFRMTKLFYNHLPPALQPRRRASNAQELVFDVPEREGGVGLNSRVKCTTAGGQGVGRSDTLTNVHMSEFAFWPGDKRDTFTGIMQAVPDRPGTTVVIESTANGYDAFKDMWDAAVTAWDAGERDGFQPLFFAWWEMEEYRREAPPDFQPTEEERDLAETYGLDREQLAWRRWCIKTNCAGDRDKFRQEYPASPDEAFIASGRCVFDKGALVLRREQVKGAVWERGNFRFDYDDARPAGKQIAGIRWEADPDGAVFIHRRPERGRPYVIGGDTAGTGSDRFTGQVLDNITGEQVAVLRHQFDETFYARQMYCLGMWYERALLAVETNYSTYPVKELERLGYPNQYTRQREDTFTGEIIKAYGFETTSNTRNLVIDILKEKARSHLETIGDYETLGEMLAFVYNEKYRPEAETGKHDDLVMALAIAEYIRPNQRTSIITAPPERQEKLIERLEKRERSPGKKRRV